jgi:hypothetical protein
MTIALVTTAWFGGTLIAGADDAGVDEVHYTFTGATSVTFDWRGPANDLRYGSTTDYGNTVLGLAPAPLPFSSAGPYWEAAITGLQPGTTYHYSIGGSPDAAFSAEPDGSFRFDVEGDVGSSLTTPHVATTQQQIAGDDPAFVLVVGDISYAKSPGITAVDQHFDDVLPWSRTAAYMPAWGNHESVPPDDLRNYKGRFELPHAQTSPGSPAVACCGEDWGWFDAGGVRFISYPEPWPGAWADWQTNVAPIMADAQNDPSINFIVTYGHRPAYSTGRHTGAATLAAAIDQLGATYPKYVLNLNGHSHDYERFAPISRVTHITSGGGGSGLETPWMTSDPRTVYRAMRLEHLRVDVSPTALHIEAICGPSTRRDDVTCTPGSIIDAITLGEEAPRASISVTVDASMHAVADASASTDADATPIDSHTFDFGDGTVLGAQASSTAEHTFAAPGTYPVSVTVTDTAGNSSAASQDITVGSVPNLVSNPDFESGTAGWAPLGRRTTLTSGPDAYSGAAGVEIQNTGASAAVCGLQDQPDSVAQTAAGTYTGSLWARSEVPGTLLKLRFREFQNGSVVGTKARNVTLTAAWQKITVRYTPAFAGASYLDFRAYLTQASPGSCFSADDAEIRAG